MSRNVRDLTVEEARARMLARIAPGETESVVVGLAAVGRVLAEPVLAVRDQPPFDASAMDGWAVQAVGAESGPRTFRIAGESAAGRPFARNGADRVGEGEAIRIFTGAAVPAGLAVVPQEQAERSGEEVRLVPPTRPTHVRPRGGDFRAGDTLLAPGVRLDAWRLALAAAAGRAEVAVARRPSVAILSTGEEIVTPGAAAVTDHQIFDSGGPALAARISAWGGAPQGLAPARDDEAAIAAAVEATDAELVVTVGGASVGDYDLVKPAMRRLGLELDVETIRLRPGRPTWFGALGDGRKVLGLPGNPASALVAAELFLRPLLLAWQGADPALPLLTARLALPLAATGPREHWMRAALASSADGALLATPYPDQDSSLVGVFARADALVRRPADAPAAPAGTPVEVLRLDRL